MRRQVLLTLLSLFFIVPTAWAQRTTGEKTEPARACNHGGFDLWHALRMIPVRFTEFNGDTAQWQYQDEYTVKLGSFALCEKAQYISQEKKAVSVLTAFFSCEMYWAFSQRANEPSFTVYSS